MTLGFKIRLLLAFRRFLAQMRKAWAIYMGYPTPPERPSADDGVRDRNEREHGGT